MFMQLGIRNGKALLKYVDCQIQCFFATPPLGN